ncbi:UNVERIFIED_CONTAM: Sentrin-specific protease 6 [Gekko kuhli]
MQLRNAAEFQFFDDDECGEPHTVFIGPIEKLIVYPPPPAKGGISVTNEDLHCLNEGEFLNDVIIDFYLKYLVLEKLKKEDADRIHVFSSFFYKRLNQRERRNLHETSKLTIQQKRHGRVKTWTRHVDIFEKDFIFVPLNEAAHWFLAVICYPGLETPVYEHNPYYQEHVPTQVKSSSSDQDRSTSPLTPCDLDTLQDASSAAVTKKVVNRKHSGTLADTGTEVEDSEFLHCRRHLCGKSGLKKLNPLTSTTDELRTLEPAAHKCDHRSSETNGMQSEPKAQIHASDGLQKIRLNYSEDSVDSTKLNEDELIDFSEDQDNKGLRPITEASASPQLWQAPGYAALEPQRSSVLLLVCPLLRASSFLHPRWPCPSSAAARSALLPGKARGAGWRSRDTTVEFVRPRQGLLIVDEGQNSIIE